MGKWVVNDDVADALHDAVECFTEALREALARLLELRTERDDLSSELDDASDCLERIGELAEAGDLAGIRAAMSIYRARR